MGKLKIIIPGNKYIEFGMNNLIIPERESIFYKTHQTQHSDKHRHFIKRDPKNASESKLVWSN